MTSVSSVNVHLSLLTSHVTQHTLHFLPNSSSPCVILGLIYTYFSSNNQLTVQIKPRGTFLEPTNSQNSLLGLLNGFPRLMGDTLCASFFSIAVGVPFFGGVHISCSSTPLDPIPRGPQSSCRNKHKDSPQVFQQLQHCCLVGHLRQSLFGSASSMHFNACSDEIISSSRD